MTGRTEEQIMENWRTKTSPLVSIICLTYNQEQYIKEAIEGFLIQETDFPFEIIIQDDASTDSTPDIIRTYVAKYPHIIRPIFQTENQFSQPRKNVLLIAAPFARGEYIACCEGDDYWTDPHKLQTQITEMQKYPNCEISFHPVLRRCINANKREKVLSAHSPHNKIFTTRQLILGGGGFCPTASFIFKSTVFQSIPSWFLDAPIGDYFLQILASLKGNALYVNRVMAVYRVGALGSWSVRMAKDENYAYHYFSTILNSLDEIDFYTHKKYTKEFNTIRKKVGFFMCINPLLSLEKRKILFSKNKITLKHKLMWHLIYKNHNLCKFLYAFRNYALD